MEITHEGATPTLLNVSSLTRDTDIGKLIQNSARISTIPHSINISGLRRSFELNCCRQREWAVYCTQLQSLVVKAKTVIKIWHYFTFIGSSFHGNRNRGMSDLDNLHGLLSMQMQGAKYGAISLIERQSRSERELTPPMFKKFQEPQVSLYDR